MLKGYKTELKLNNRQKTFMQKSCGCARFAYNWGLSERIRLYKEEKKSLTHIDQHKELVKLKHTTHPWLKEVSKLAPQNSLRNLHKAFANFFRNIKKGKKPGFPKFKKKNLSNKFRIDGDNIYVTNSTIKLPRIGILRLKEKNYIPIPAKNIKYLNATVSRDVDRWFISVNIEEIEDKEDNPKPKQPKKIEEIIGIDLGIKELATCSNGYVYHNPKTLYKYHKKLASEQRSLSRKIKGSNNRNKQRIKVAKIHRKIRNIRKDNLHKMTSSITKTKCRLIVLEDLNVEGMLKNHKLAKSISDASFSEIKRQLDYKVDFYGGELYLVDQWFPSSKLCSNCNQIKDNLTLSDRTYKCDHCNLVIDRDLNASINIKNYKLISYRELHGNFKLSLWRECVSNSAKQKMNINPDLNDQV